ncbi:hypothetical protein BKA66DRAFT_451495 [Pyrenochaeta sp. MPI-SDFR-AT-0127]|nr:hypothetical protein BKA66DRAFT_451495 [Pyrenochaeta sp. MPI-SDFR-AT-0127]
MPVPKDVLIIDTRASPTGSFGETAVHGMYVDQSDTIMGGFTTTVMDNLRETITMPTIALSQPMETMPPKLQTSSSPGAAVSSSFAANAKPQAENTLPGGAIFAIVVGSIVGIIFPFFLFTRYITRGRRMKKEREILEETLATGFADEKAQDMGLRRLLDASSRKWAADHYVSHFEQGDLDARRAREKANAESLLLQSVFNSQQGNRRL